MPAFVELLRRRWLPGTVIAVSTWHGPARVRAALRRAIGRRPRIELYFAFDDPYAAIALPGLMRIAGRYGAQLALYPLLERGLENDPALDKRRQHAIADSRLLARRDGRELRRAEPVGDGELDELAAQAEALRGDPVQPEFCARALERVWFGSRDPLQPQDAAGVMPDAGVRARLAANTARLKRLGHWESPAARVEGAWFFAHERIEQIEDRLAELGWRAR